ncbi:hypothetical protein VTG60DRAFT_4291 [Thermothelomyces hinnuleus]
MARSPPQRKRRNTSIDSEALAEMEGRLPPIYENKTYPRATMGSDEIMALCAAAEDNNDNDSSDLGPPPVSRYIEDNSATNSPTKAIETHAPESPMQPVTNSLHSQLDQVVQPSESPEPEKEADDVAIEEASPIEQAAPEERAAPEPSPQPARPGVKRKYGDEDGTIQSVTPVVAGKENDVLTEKSFPARAGQKRRSLADLASVKPEKKSTRAPLSAKRTPLAAKSTNEDMSSPRKAIKATPLKDAKKERQRIPGDTAMQDEGNAPKPPVEIVIPADHSLLESATSLPSENPSSPATPPRSAQREVLHDTPPPADISSTGETTRPTRRARAPISYAEPNLRDKMRRPTKELFDAVTGEGKYAHRIALQFKSDGHQSAPTSVSKAKVEPGSSTSSRSKTSSFSDRAPTAQQQALLSPLAQKDALPDSLQSTVVMERRKRTSAAAGGNRTSLAAQEKPDSASREPSPAIVVGHPEGGTQTSNSRRRTSVAKANNDNQQLRSPPPAAEVDIYDFTASSPAIPSSKAPAPDTSSQLKSTSSHPAITTQISNPPGSRLRTARKSSMAAAAALRELLDEEENEAESEPQRQSAPPKSRTAHGGRKRASMLVPKKTSMLLEEGLEDDSEAADADTSGTSAEGDSGSGNGSGRISRRRSMML